MVTSVLKEMWSGFIHIHIRSKASGILTPQSVAKQIYLHRHIIISILMNTFFKSDVFSQHFTMHVKQLWVI